MIFEQIIILEDFIMGKYIYNESNGLWSELKENYYFPCLTLPAQEEKLIQRHLSCLKKYRKGTYINLLTSGRLNAHVEIDKQAQKHFERLIEGTKQTQGI